MGYAYGGSNRKVGPEPYQCGTDRAYQAHKRRGEDIDEACAEAHRAARRKWYAERRVPTVKKPRPPRLPSTRGNAPTPDLKDVWSAHAQNA